MGNGLHIFVFYGSEMKLDTVSTTINEPVILIEMGLGAVSAGVSAFSRTDSYSVDVRRYINDYLGFLMYSAMSYRLSPVSPVKTKPDCLSITLGIPTDQLAACKY